MFMGRAFTAFALTISFLNDSIAAPACLVCCDYMSFGADLAGGITPHSGAAPESQGQQSHVTASQATSRS